MLFCVCSPSWCAITGCIGGGRRGNANNVGRWVLILLVCCSILTNNITSITFFHNFLEILNGQFESITFNFKFLLFCRASSRSLRSTVKRLWPSAAPGANRL